MWMNEQKIRYISTAVTNPPQVVRAAAVLVMFVDLINSISDGWPYWSYGTRCSGDLCNIVDRGQWPCGDIATPADVAAAIEKIKHFLTHCGQTKDRPEVRTFLQHWRLR